MGNGTARPIVSGLILIVLGILFLLGNFGAFNVDWEALWTWIVILLGVIFWLGFIIDRDRDGLIMPGTILLTIGIVLNLSSRYQWASMSRLWPFFILAPAFGFYAKYLVTRRERGLLVPAVILTIIGLGFLMSASQFMRYLGPILMIALGVLLLVRAGRPGARRRHGPDDGPSAA